MEELPGGQPATKWGNIHICSLYVVQLDPDRPWSLNLLYHPHTNTTQTFRLLPGYLGIWFWPRWLCVRYPRWPLQCVAGHCYYQLSVSLFFSLSSFPSFWPRRLCVHHLTWCLQCAGYCYYQLSLFFLLFLRLLLLTHFGETPKAENLFPPKFWHNSQIYAKNIFFGA